MSNLYKVLILLFAFFGLGISCASAANVVSFNPQTVELYPGSSQDFQIVMDEVPDGLSGFNITISILNPEIAEITAVSFPGWGMLPRNSTLPSGSVWIKVADLDSQVGPGDTNVLLGTITVIGKKVGTTDLDIPTTKINADGGGLIIPVVIAGSISVLDNEDTEDNEAPVINSVSLSSTTPETGDLITVTVDVTDNVGVSSVEASGVALANTGGNLWEGTIFAEEGTHKVTVTASDAAGNTAVDESASYTATSDSPTKVEAEICFSPNTLNLGSGGQWVTVYIELPEEYNAAEINASSVLLNGAVSAITDPKYNFVTDESEYLTDIDLDGISERMLKFDRKEVESLLEAGDEVTVTFTGEVEYTNGISSGMASFEGSSVIKVIEKDSKKDKAK